MSKITRPYADRPATERHARAFAQALRNMLAGMAYVDTPITLVLDPEEIARHLPAGNDAKALVICECPDLTLLGTDIELGGHFFDLRQSAPFNASRLDRWPGSTLDTYSSWMVAFYAD